MSIPAPKPRIVSDVPQLAPRRPEAHKGDAGRVAIVAGSPGMSGAAILCGLGALRGGAGLVRVFTPASIQPVVAVAEPCLMTVALDQSTPDTHHGEKHRSAEEVFAWADVRAIGPGLGQGGESAARLYAAIAGTRVPLVLDADALNILAQDGLEKLRQVADDPPWWRDEALSIGAPVVVTPHPGEMARLREAAGLSALAGDDDETRIQIAHEYAVLTGDIVVLKGHRTVVCTAGTAYVNTTGNPGMATGGMGDVLTGLIAALIAQGLPPFDAARLGVWAHGRAADMLAEEIGPFGYLAREVADALPRVWQQC